MSILQQLKYASNMHADKLNTGRRTTRQAKKAAEDKDGVSFSALLMSR